MLISSSLYFDGWAQGVPSVAPPATAFPSSGDERKAHLLQRYRFYAGSHAAVQVFEVQSTGYAVQDAILLPLYLFAGYQLTPHLAIQAGFLQRTSIDRHVTSASVNQANQPVAFLYNEKQHDASVPLLLRCRLARQPTHRLYLDALLGATLLFHRYQVDQTLTVGGQVTNDVHFDLPTRHVYLTGGLSAGCRVAPHVDLLVEATASRDTEKTVADVRPFLFGVGAGLRYGFNVGKPTEGVATAR